MPTLEGPLSAGTYQVQADRANQAGHSCPQNLISAPRYLLRLKFLSYVKQWSLLTGIGSGDETSCCPRAGRVIVGGYRKIILGDRSLEPRSRGRPWGAPDTSSLIEASCPRYELDPALFHQI